MSVEFIKRQAKQAAKVLPGFLAQHPLPLSHSQNLELVSKLHGYPSYHAAQATAKHASDGVPSQPMGGGEVVGPWWCDTCGERIVNVSDGYVVFRRDEDQKAFDFLVVHQTKRRTQARRCDPRGDHTSSMALDRLLGPSGLNRLLSMLASGPVKVQGEEHGPYVLRFEQFVDLVRRLQAPGYELARRYFNDPKWAERLGDWNEYAPYDPDSLAHLLTWEISELREPADHEALCERRYEGEVRIAWSDGDQVEPVSAVFYATSLVAKGDAGTLNFGYCADGKFRHELLSEHGARIGVVSAELVPGAGVMLKGVWKGSDESADFSLSLSEVTA
jgi:hypothetical protein